MMPTITHILHCRHIALTLALCLPVMCGYADRLDNYHKAIAERDQGAFANATALLNSSLEQNTSDTLTPEETSMIKFEIERIRRIRQDYTKTRDDVMAQMQKLIPDFSSEELDQFERNGEVDSMTIDGAKFYVNATASNLLKRDIKLRKRSIGDKENFYSPLYDVAKQAIDAKQVTSNTLILPYDVAVTYTLTVKPNAVPAGQVLRAWLPAPRMQPNQSDFVLLGTSNPAILAPPESTHRSIYMEQIAKDNEPTTFTASYAYRSWTRAFNPRPEDVLPYDKENPIYKKYTASRPPHLDLDNEYLKTLNHEIVAEETNPLLVAKRIHDWMGKNIIYQYAREYSTLDNISLYTAKRRAGDCGQHGMFFIAMCRMNGIPARWSTGWFFYLPEHEAGLHDWTEIYVEPWGWMPVDPDIALLTQTTSDDFLTTDQKQLLSDWLFCNQDPYRMTVNSDYGCKFYPEKQDFRSETVDFQRGEVESNGRNLYFEDWKYKMTIQPLRQGELEKLITPVKY